MRRIGFLDIELTPKAKKVYERLSRQEQRQCDEALAMLILRELSSGLDCKPIWPGKFFYEARINLRLRLVIREAENSRARIIDICTHDELSKYGRGR